MRWVGRVACIGIMRNTRQVLFVKPEEKILLGRLGVGRNKILEQILGKQGGSCGLDSFGTGLGPGAGSCEHSNEP